MRNRVEVLQDLFTELSALEAAYLTQKICFFRPNPKGNQAKFFKDEAANIRLVIGDNRSGKSTVGAVEAIAHSLGYRPWLDKEHPQYIVKLPNGEPIPVPNKGRIIAQDYQQAIKQTIFPKIQEWAPRGWYTIKKDNRGIPVEIKWKNGSIIYLMSDDQDDDKFEGTNGHWFWADEPIGYAKYVALKRGLIDFSGHCWLTLTPLSQAWIADRIHGRANAADGKVKSYHFSIWDNWVGNGGVLRREDIEEFIEDLDEDQRAIRVGGQWFNRTGRVYRQWVDEDPYWIPMFKEGIPKTWPRVCIIDPHPRKPIAVLWMAISPDNQRYVYRDLFDNRLQTVSDVARRVFELEGWKYVPDLDKWVQTADTEPVAIRLIDPSSKERERTSGDTILHRFAREGIRCQPASKKNAQAGYDAIHEALKVRREWGEPELIVFNTCQHVKRNFLNFVWDEWATSKQKELKGAKQEVRKTEDDFIDCIRYTYQTGINYHSLRRAERQHADADPYAEVISGTGMLTGEKYGWPM